MENEVTQSLEQRLRILAELAGSIEKARAAVLGSDLVELEVQNAQQRELCTHLCRLGRPGGTPSERWSRLLEECAQTEMRVFRLNQEYGALLARARRTINIFCRVLANSEITYPPPKPARTHLGVES